MVDEHKKRWSEIYRLALEIEKKNPWSRFRETDMFVFRNKQKKYEHFFCFLKESSGQKGIALYPTGNACFLAQQRMHEKNYKNEPAFYLQDAIILLWGNREEVSKGNLNLIKELGLKFRGKGCWPHFREYRVGHVPRDVEHVLLDILAADMDSLLSMVQTIDEQNLKVDFSGNRVYTRCWFDAEVTYLNRPATLRRSKRGEYLRVELLPNNDIAELRKMIPRGTICMDWSFYPGVIEYEKKKVIPRLLLVMEPRTGELIKKVFIPPSSEPYKDILTQLEFLIRERGKPSTIEICDKEMECYIADTCKLIGIRLVVKPQIKQITLARRELLAAEKCKIE